MDNTELQPFYVEVGDHSAEDINYIFKLAIKCGATWNEQAEEFGWNSETTVDRVVHYGNRYFGVDFNLKTYFYQEKWHFGYPEIPVLMTYQEAEDYLLSLLEEVGDSASDPTLVEEPTEDVVDLTNTFVLIRDKEHCEAVQEYLFSKGYGWLDGGFSILDIYIQGELPCIFTNKGLLTWGGKRLTDKKITEVVIDYKKTYDFTVTFKEDEKVKELQEKLREVVELANKLQQEIDALLGQILGDIVVIKAPYEVCDGRLGCNLTKGTGYLVRGLV